MQLTLLLTTLLSLVTLSYSFDVTALPDCSILCFVNGLQKTGCALTDTLCQCTTGKQAFADAATPCLLAQCSPQDQTRVAGIAAVVCASVYSVADGLIPSATAQAAVSGSGSSAAIATATANAAPPIVQKKTAFGSVVVVAVVVAGGLAV